MLSANPLSRDSIQSVATDKSRVVLRRKWLLFLIGTPLSLYLMFLGWEIVSEEHKQWGWVVGVAGFLLFGASGLRYIVCSFCNKDDMVGVLKQNHKCSKCHHLTIIDWSPR